MTLPIATIAPAYACDLKWNASLRWQIRCASDAFNGTLFATREEAAACIATLIRCGCGRIVRDGSPHAKQCQI